MHELRLTPCPDGDGSSSVDRDRLLMLVDNDLKLLGEIIDLFLEDAPGWLESIRYAVSAEDGNALRDGAHALRGALANFAADRASRIAHGLEIRGRDGKLGGASAELESLEREMAAISYELKSLV